MEVIPSIIYHFQSYVYMAGYTSAYLNYKFSRVSQFETYTIVALFSTYYLTLHQLLLEKWWVVPNLWYCPLVLVFIFLYDETPTILVVMILW